MASIPEQLGQFPTSARSRSFNGCWFPSFDQPSNNSLHTQQNLQREVGSEKGLQRKQTEKPTEKRRPSQQLVLTKVHSLDNVPTIIEHTSNVLSVHSACKMRITVMFPVATWCTYSLKKKIREKSTQLEQSEISCSDNNQTFLEKL